MFEYLVIGWAAVLGLLLGSALTRALARKVVDQAKRRAARMVEEGKEAAAEVKRRVETEAREQALAVRREAEALERQSEEQNALLEERVRKLEARNEKREADIAKNEAAQEKRRAAAQELKAQTAQIKQESRDKRQAYRAGLEERAGETAEQIENRLREALVEETRAQCGDRLRNLETTQAEELTRQAKRVMGISMGRYQGHFLTERMASTLALPEKGAERLAEHLSFLEQETGVRFLLAETGESVRLEGGDGTSRELARRSVTRFLAENRVRDPERLLKSIAADLDREILELGKEAFRVLGLQPAHQEIVRLVGRLNFRTSYTQNQWRHSIESAFLAGLMAAELGLDVRTARRGTLLHDIGKALTHEVEGSHAVIGAEYARKYGEDEVVANAVASHHGDEPARSSYAQIVAAADAMSGARPGARREMVETYVERIADLERIATSFPGVVLVHAVQAGRELRVHVDEHKVDEKRAAALSEEIAGKISEEMAFPGQIRVTVIREFRAVEMAG